MVSILLLHELLVQCTLASNIRMFSVCLLAFDCTNASTVWMGICTIVYVHYKRTKANEHSVKPYKHSCSRATIMQHLLCYERHLTIIWEKSFDESGRVFVCRLSLYIFYASVFYVSPPEWVNVSFYSCYSNGWWNLWKLDRKQKYLKRKNIQNNIVIGDILLKKENFQLQKQSAENSKFIYATIVVSYWLQLIQTWSLNLELKFAIYCESKYFSELNVHKFVLFAIKKMSEKLQYFWFYFQTEVVCNIKLC